MNNLKILKISKRENLEKPRKYRGVRKSISNEFYKSQEHHETV